jgi:hypothetical protein
MFWILNINKFIYNLENFQLSVDITNIQNTFNKKNIMKWNSDFRIVPLSCQLKTVYKGMTFRRIKEFYTVVQRFPNTVSKFSM